MKIVIPGGTGQVGHMLRRAFERDGHDLVILTRQPAHAAGRTRFVTWDGCSPGDWAREIDGSHIVINLTGRSVNCRYTPANRRLIMDSRLDSTRAISRAIADALRPPRVWLQSSTATIYAHRYDAPNDEHTGILGGSEPDAPDTWRFSIDVATRWEQAATDPPPPPGTRLVIMRTAMVMSPDPGGVFDVLLGLVRLGLGGKHGDGRQFMSWIHEHDFTAAVRWLIDHDDLAGPVNLASPQPLPDAQFMSELRRAWGARVGLPAVKWMLEIGTWLMRSESELVLKSRRVVPRRLLDSGFVFRHPTWRDAAHDLCERRRQ